MKSNILKVIIGLVFLIVFNALFFLLGGATRTTTEWVCYGFIHASYLCLLCTPLLYTSRKNEAVLSASLYLRAMFYFFTELIIGLLFLAFKPDSPTWPAIIQGALLMLFIILQLMSVLANDATHKSLAKQTRERVYIRGLAEDVRHAMHQISDSHLRELMDTCYMKLNNCSLESFPQAEDAEMELENSVNTLCSIIEQGHDELIEKQIQVVLNAIQKRNRAIRTARYSY